MNVGDPIKLVSQLIDLPIIDMDGRWCGIVDDVEFSGSAGKETRIKALLVGPGAYEGRMPSWLFRLVRGIAGDRMARVPVEKIVEIDAVVRLGCQAEELKLHSVENKVRAWIPRRGAL
jgi:sporulation protein YlmC with PRC-barrel domain